ncbi:hypothetical protein F5X68DRAFT_232480 [Plectosphaerella plurivora]|uniref:Spo12-like protein n=1 Tax=Plectosphaerella plurivora TaxID=936078 RepID=A0A9P9A9T0_9PEZI|nr:hypothetical protein F5X68DRAFT_232480 [Plectosphaerella plurivora]
MSALTPKDINAPVGNEKNLTAGGKADVKSMEYHRQMLQNKMAREETTSYISPSDNIMSPCTAKLTALRNKQIGKVKPKSLFAQTSSKKLGADIFGTRTTSPPKGGDA